MIDEGMVVAGWMVVDEVDATVVAVEVLRSVEEA